MRALEYQLSELTVRGYCLGEPDLPVLLCLHGWLDNLASFELLTPYLDAYQIVMIDLPGHGFSDHKAKGAYYHFIDWVSDLHQLLTVAAWQKVHLLGHSMGGMIATAFAAAFPEKVLSLTLIDSLGFLTVDPENTTEQLRKGIISRHKFNTQQQLNIQQEPNTPSDKSIKTYHTMQDAINARVKHSDLSYALASIIVKRSLFKLNNKGYQWRYDPRLKLISPYRFSKAQAENLMQSVQAPCLIISAKYGIDFIKQSIESQLALFHNISCYYLEGGHHIHMEKPEQVAQHINHFLSKNI